MDFTRYWNGVNQYQLVKTKFRKQAESKFEFLCVLISFSSFLRDHSLENLLNELILIHTLKDHS